MLRRSSGEPWCGRASLPGGWGTGSRLKEESKPQLGSSDLSPAPVSLDSKPEFSLKVVYLSISSILNSTSEVHQM